MLASRVLVGLLFAPAAAFAAAAPISPTVEIAPGVEMFRVSLGTCCGSQPKARPEQNTRPALCGAHS